MRVFKIKCPECGQPAIIRKSDWKDKKLADLYCACTEVECGHTFVFNASFSHTLSPSGLTGNKLVKFLIDRLTPEERQFTLELLNNNSI
ncbi:ogr/Delta-like zinc finger family protein [Enterobacter cloacae]|uniref:ogr/Delta-like zinc finger family protein n=1 Tax=Enterobacter TaxID=547 RepID=UPI0011E81BFA|nr:MULTISPECIES: ogr/Delta-like zinc finger family protein [Enterobacter]HAS0822371.1 ogr/Delta-like zinc finger family protein [Enterobacter cloacae subsp. cloacae]ELV2770152.1 ogr/Delta-like zinc finger family protein [Enterobacter cloacae]ELV2776163.1 ogr/Delta-like zinc finger family protein [Enterobacter cloacae]MCK7175581.1 ogr/Delta-like zinc finger family protein [Enterobacter cloacae]TYR23022.1 ogr/Delta-like zinc finger family protein [Enterobacter cloacae]